MSEAGSVVPTLQSSNPPAVNRWLIAVTVTFGAFMAVMNISVVNVAMPHMMGTFGQDLSSITWVATSYSIAEIIMVSMAGWWSMLIGRKRLYLWSFALFTGGSILCSMAQTFPQMLFFRVIQGIGGGALIPISQAILRESFPPEEQSIAMAFFGMGVVLAPAIGPVIGGWLTDQYGWPWIFFVNVPVSIFGMFMVKTFVHDPAYLRRGIKKIDWLGIIFMSIALIGMQVVLERGQEENWFESIMITSGTILTIAATIALIWWELITDEPIINLRLLKNLSLSLGSIIGIVFGIALFGTTFILPQFTQELLGYPAFQAGLVLAPRAIMLIISMPLVGKLYTYIDAKILMFIGIIIVFWSYYDLSQLSLSAGFGDLVIILMIMGLGMPFVFVTLSTMSLATVSNPDMTDASSLYTLSRRLGGNIGYALAVTLVARGQQIHRVHLVDHISIFNPNLTTYTNVGTSLIARTGIGPTAASHTSMALANSVVNQQATMLAYNDVSWIFGLLFLCIIPFLFFIPKRLKVY